MHLVQESIQRNKKSSAGTRTSSQQAMKQAFDSSEIRSWLKKGGKVYSPGPGQYIDLSSKHFIGNNTMNIPQSEHGARNRTPKGNRSNFLTKSTRFTGGFFTTKDGPGPGEYDSEVKSEDNQQRGILTKAQINNRGKSGAVFRSTTNRFLDNDKDNPSIRILDKNSGQQYNDLMIYNIKASTAVPQSRGMINYKRKVGFTATSPRFTHNQVFYGEKLKYTPGPGDYHSAASRPKSFSHSRGVGRRQGFGSYVVGKGTNTTVGPGSYLSTDWGMIKKSYNMRI